ncbi:FAD-dependent oxidoreductase [Acholeplasma equirhinis]|uniref:FAD-dependent oxidoreductase n=1 Tax=Acholeplasma equirhinis TaxID=555393 RepID=UPI00197AE272|nr:FAD-dependent oxidoreductase [Acholeplasma equirhinis]MBN3490263.1 FAD-dependent oxidoreductase [Acholeplasma equirhinis]
MKSYDLVIIGGGVAGIAAAIEATKLSMNAIIIEQGFTLGGKTRLIAHKMKSYNQNGQELLEVLLKDLDFTKVDILTNHSVAAIYTDLVVTATNGEDFVKVQAKSILVTTGTYQKTIAFPNNDLPNIFGVITTIELLNLYGIKPGNEAIILGSSFTELVKMYLEIAEIKIVEVIDPNDLIEAFGKDKFEGVRTSKGEYKADFLVVCGGLLPAKELLNMLDAEMEYDSFYDAYKPKLENHQTSINGVFVAGNLSGMKKIHENIEEAKETVNVIYKRLGESNG